MFLEVVPLLFKTFWDICRVVLLDQFGPGIVVVVPWR